MAVVPQEAINQFEALMDEVDEPLKRTFQNVHQGYPHETLTRFLKAREGNVTKATKMLTDCLEWRVQNEIDDMLAKPIVPVDHYRAIRDSQLIGLSGYSNEGFPVFAVGVGLSTFDKASVHYYVQSHIQMNEYRDRVILPAVSKKCGKLVSKCIKILDMTGLKLAALNQIKVHDQLKIHRSFCSNYPTNYSSNIIFFSLSFSCVQLVTLISSIDDLNYPEKTLTYYIVNSPYVFSACWKVVKPLLHERTQRKINVLSGCGQDELLKIMDYSSLPHFCRKRSSGSSNYNNDNCYILDHPFHQQLYNYIKRQAVIREPVKPIKQGSAHITMPENAGDEDVAKTLESELLKFKNV